MIQRYRRLNSVPRWRGSGVAGVEAYGGRWLADGGRRAIEDGGGGERLTVAISRPAALPDRQAARPGGASA